MAKPVTLYRYFDADDVLLYVGITQQGIRRSFQHYGSSAWWPKVARATFQSFPTLPIALEAERSAILRENPRHNKAIGRYRPHTGHRSLVIFAAYAQGRTHLNAPQLAAVLGVDIRRLDRIIADGMFRPDQKVAGRRLFSVDRLCPELRVWAGLRPTRPFGQPCMDPADLEQAELDGLVEVFGANPRRSA